MYLLLKKCTYVRMSVCINLGINIHIYFLKIKSKITVFEKKCEFFGSVYHENKKNKNFPDQRSPSVFIPSQILKLFFCKTYELKYLDNVYCF